MDQHSIEQVLNAINDTNESYNVIHGWVSSPCPFARWKHASGRDKKPSFGIKIDDNGTSYVNCFTCKTHGTVSDMLEELQAISGEDYTDLIDEVYDGEVLGGFIPSWEARRNAKKVSSTIPAPPDIVYHDLYDELPDGHWYLEDRGIDADTAVNLDLRIDPNDKGLERILFPVHSMDGTFYGYSGRATEDSLVDRKNPKVRDYFGLPKKFLLLGADKLSQDDEYVMVVEGLMDYAKCYAYGLPSVATLHSGASSEQLAILRRIGKPIVLFQDNDKAGNEGNCYIAEHMYKHLPVYGVYYPGDEYKDPGALKERHILNMLDDLEYLPDLKSIADHYGYTVRNGKIHKGLSNERTIPTGSRKRRSA